MGTTTEIERKEMSDDTKVIVIHTLVVIMLIMMCSILALAISGELILSGILLASFFVSFGVIVNLAMSLGGD